MISQYSICFLNIFKCLLWLQYLLYLIAVIRALALSDPERELLITYTVNNNLISF